MSVEPATKQGVRSGLGPLNVPNASSARSGQAWSIDFILSLMLFVIAAVLAVRIVLSITGGSDFDQVRIDATDLSAQLMTQGIPANWNSSLVISPGLLTSGQLNRTKWVEFAGMNLSRTKLLLGIESDYVIILRRLNTSLPPPVLPCYAGVNLTNASCTSSLAFPEGSDVVRIDRLVAHNGTILSMTFYVWA